MKKLSIGIVCPYDIFRFGGVQQHVLSVAHELRHKGHTVKIIAPTPANPPKKYDRNIILLGASTKMNTPMATTLELAVSASPKDIDAVLKANAFDILHFHEPWVPVLSGQVLSRSRSRNVATFHAHIPDDLMNKSLEKIWLPYGKNRNKYVHYITAVSEAAAEYVRTATPEPIHIIPNGIHLAQYRDKSIKSYPGFRDNKALILFIGRLEKRKGVSHLLKSYQILKQRTPNVRLVIAGDGPKRRSLQNYVERHNLDDISFLGFVSEDDKLSLLKRADVFCSPALFGESFGIVLLEAMAMGVPVVAGNNPGYVSVMKGTGRLSLVDPKNHLDMSHRLELMLYDKGVRRLFRHWAEDYVTQFDYAVIARQYEDAFIKLHQEHA